MARRRRHSTDIMGRTLPPPNETEAEAKARLAKVQAELDEARKNWSPATKHVDGEHWSTIHPGTTGDYDLYD